MSSNNLVAWPSDVRIQGYRVRFPARAGHFGVTFWSWWDHLFVNFGMCWEVFGSTLGMFSGGVGKVPRGSKISKITFSKNVWDYVSSVGGT